MRIPTPVVLGTLFLSVGAFDGMLGVAWPTIANQLDRSIGDLGILLAAYLVASMAGSLSANWLMQRLGLKRSLICAGTLTVISAIAIALAPSWILLLAAAALRGYGNGAVHTYLNTYGGKTLSSRRLMVVHSAWGGGAALSAMTMTYLVSQGLTWQINLLWCVVPGLVGVLAVRTLREISPATQDRTPVALGRLDWMAVLATGFYVAVEASVGNWAFTLMTEGWAAPVALAGTVTSIFWALMTLCRLGLSAFPVTAQQWLKLMPVLLAGSTILLFAGQYTFYLGAAGVLLAGFSASVIFPNLISRGVANSHEKNHGKVTGLMLTTAACGGASGPGLMGVIAGAGGLLLIPIPMLAIGILGAYFARQVADGPSSADARTTTTPG